MKLNRILRSSSQDILVLKEKQPRFPPWIDGYQECRSWLFLGLVAETPVVAGGGVLARRRCLFEGPAVAFPCSEWLKSGYYVIPKNCEQKADWSKRVRACCRCSVLPCPASEPNNTTLYCTFSLVGESQRYSTLSARDRLSTTIRGFFQ